MGALRASPGKWVTEESPRSVDGTDVQEYLEQRVVCQACGALAGIPSHSWMHECAVVTSLPEYLDGMDVGDDGPSAE